MLFGDDQQVPGSSRRPVRKCYNLIIFIQNLRVVGGGVLDDIAENAVLGGLGGLGCLSGKQSLLANQPCVIKIHGIQ